MTRPPSTMMASAVLSSSTSAPASVSRSRTASPMTAERPALAKPMLPPFRSRSSASWKSMNPALAETSSAESFSAGTMSRSQNAWMARSDCQCDRNQWWNDCRRSAGRSRLRSSHMRSSAGIARSRSPTLTWG